MDNKKKRIIKISVFITSIFVIFLSVTYAFINVQLAGTKKQVITAGTLDLILDEDENNLNIENAFPTYDEVGMIQDPFTFRLKNNAEIETNYILKLTNITTGDQLDTSIVKYNLTKNGVGEPAILSTLPEDGTIDSGTIGNKETIEYTLRLWINSDVTDNEAISGKSLSYRVDVEASMIEETSKESIAEILNLASKVDTETKINFNNNSSSTNGRGIYIYQEDGEDIYYWRGKVDEVDGAANHVLFAGYCWYAVRTTKDGGLKMIYDGTPDENGHCTKTGTESQLSSVTSFNIASNDNAYVGYMYGLTGVTSAYATTSRCIKLNSAKTAAEVGVETTEVDCTTAGGKWTTTAYEATHANVVNSNIKTKIDEWFEASELNTEENLKKLEDAIYCNDRSISEDKLGYGSNVSTYLPYDKYDTGTDKVPNLECSLRNDRFTVSVENGNGDLTYPVGLLTVDEMILAGGTSGGETNYDHYLANNQVYWLLTSSNFNGSFTVNKVVSPDGNGSGGPSNYSYGIRPVITLASGNQLSGLGTEDAPYVVN